MVVRPSKGGAFGHALRLCRELGSRGYECALVGPHDQPRGDHAPRVFRLEIPRYPHPIRHPIAIARLGAIYRRYRPHVVHAHGSQGGVVARLARFARPRTPVVLTPHNYAFTNYFTRGPERALYRLIEISLAPLATRVICVCEAERRVAVRIGPSKRTRVVYNGIEPLPAVPASAEVARLAEAGPLVGTVAELQPPKGVPTLIAAMPAMLRGLPSANLAVAGTVSCATRWSGRSPTSGSAGRCTCSDRSTTWRACSAPVTSSCSRAGRSRFPIRFSRR